MTEAESGRAGQGQARRPGTLTIVLTEPGALGTALLDVVTVWSESGLLEPVFWADPGGALEGRWVRGGPDGSATLLRTVLAGTEHEAFRMVHVQFVTGDDPPDPKEDPLPTTTSGAGPVAEQRARALALAELLEDRRSDPQELIRTNLIVSRDGTPQADLDRLLDGWQANLVVSPEDRLNDRSADAKLVTDDDLVRHAALHLATVAGLWRGQPSVPMDDLKLVYAATVVPVAVIRAFVALVLADSAGQDVVDRVFAKRAHRDAASWAEAVPARDPGAAAASAAADLLQRAGGGGFLFHSAGAPPEPIRATMGSWRALILFARLVLGRLRAFPRELVAEVGDDARTLAERLVQHLTVGPDSVVAVQVAERPPDPDAGPRTGEDRARAVLEVLAAAATPPAQPEMWTDLRVVCLGLLDGGTFPSHIPPPRDAAHREILLDPGLVVPEPLGAGLEPTDPAAPPSWASLTRHTRLVDIRRARWLRSRAREYQPADSAAAAEREADGWLDRWTATTLGNVAGAVSDEIDAANASLQERLDLLHTFTGTPPPEPSPGSWPAPLAAGAGGALAGGAGYWLGPHGLPGILLAAAMAAGAWAVLGVGAAVLQYRAELRRVFRIRRRELAFTHAAAAAMHEAREVLRLNQVYATLLDWAEIIAWLVHVPGGRPAAGAAAPGAIDTLPRTYALRVARGEADGGELEHLVGLVGRTRLAAGWLTDLFGGYDRLVVAERKRRLGLREESIDAVVEAQQVDEIRGELLAAVRAGRLADEWLANFFQTVMKQLGERGEARVYPLALERSHPSHAAPPARPPTPPGSPPLQKEDPTDPEGRLWRTEQFLLDVTPRGTGPQRLSRVSWPKRELLGDAAAVGQCHVWLPDTVQTDDLPEAVERSGSEPWIDAGRLIMVSVRLDLTRADQPGALELFRASAERARGREAAMRAAATPNPTSGLG